MPCSRDTKPPIVKIKTATTSTEIYQYIRDNLIPIMTSIGIEQTPEYGGLFLSGHDGGEFIFLPTTNRLRD